MLKKDDFKQGQMCTYLETDLQKLDFIRALASSGTGIKPLKPDTLLYLLESESYRLLNSLTGVEDVNLGHSSPILFFSYRSTPALFSSIKHNPTTYR